MKKNNSNHNVWGIFRVGDIVKDSKDSVWGNTKFEITYLHGNWYCPLLSADIIGKFHKNSNTPQRCNLDAREVRLVNSVKRPFRKIDKISLVKLMKKGNIEAKREFNIRLNTKTL